MKNGHEICQDLVNIRKARMILKDKRDNMFFIRIGTMGRFTVATCKFIDSPPDLLVNLTFAVPSAYKETGQFRASLEGNIQGGAYTEDA